jgi:DNA-directed RNA polymerase specialized sigma24 family protein
LPLTFDQFLRLLDEPPLEPCESELKYLSKARSVARFHKAWRSWYRSVTYLIASITHDYSAAPELAQEVFFSVYQRRVSLAKAYIYRAARYAAYSELRRRSRDSRALAVLQAGVTVHRGKSQKVEAQDTRPLPDAELMERARELEIDEALRAVEEARAQAHGHDGEIARLGGETRRLIGEMMEDLNLKVA